MKPAFRAAGVAAAVAIVFALYWSLRLACADLLYERNTVASVQRAIRLAPGDPRFHRRLAHLLGEERALETAAALDPLASANWIELGLAAEARKDFASAERYLLEAARVDRTWEPRWTLANYWFRRGDAERFWPWAREAAAIAYGNQTPLFRLCWELSQDPALILDRAVPPRVEVRRQYLGFLLSTRRLEAALDAALALLPLAAAEDAPVLLSACDRFLAAGHTAAALHLWNAMAERRLVAHAPLAPERGQALTNGRFSTPPGSRGFDWRIPRAEGVSARRFGNQPALRISFDGRQAERVDSLSQYLPLLPARVYRFRFDYRTDGIAPGTGVRWALLDAGIVLWESTDLSHEGWKQETALFETPAALQAPKLVLLYARARGTKRIEGSLLLRDLTLEFHP